MQLEKTITQAKTKDIPPNFRGINTHQQEKEGNEMKKYLAIVLCLVMMVGVLAGCGTDDPGTVTSDTPASTSPDGSASGDGIKIGMITMGEASFWDAVAEGVRNVMHEGDELVFVEGEHGNAAGQVGIIEDFITQGCDVVLFNPVDADAASSCLDLLEEANIPVINFDSPCTDMSTVESFCATDNYAAGVLAADFMAEEHPEGGTVAVLVYESAASCVDRCEGFIDRINEIGGWEVVTELDGGNTTDAALPVAEDILTTYPDLDCIFAGNDEMGLGAYSAITSAGADVDLYSVNGGPEAKAMMQQDGEDGVWRATSAQSPIKMGEQSMELAYMYLDGETLEDEYLIDPFIINPANVAEYADSDWQ